jgi:hypothetical protein
MSLEQGFSITALPPLTVGEGIPLRLPFTSYSHEIATFGGFKNSEIGVPMDRTDLEDWLGNGLGRSISVRSDDGIVFEGMINSMTITIGPVAITIGPVLGGVANKVLGTFSVQSGDAQSAISHPASDMLPSEDLTSQQRYGIIEKRLSLGTVKTIAEAQDLCEVYVKMSRNPRVSKELNLYGTDINMTLHVVGWFQWLTAYIYETNPDLSAAEQISLSDKLIAVLDYDLNKFIAHSWAYIDTNKYLVNKKEDSATDAQAVVQKILSLGGEQYQRMSFGVYEFRTPYYTAVPTEPSYRFRVSDPAGHIEDMSGNPVPPWLVRPGNWALIEDVFPVGGPGIWDMDQDPRFMFIETVRYTAPTQVQLTGSRTSTLLQQLAQAGIAVGEST